MNQKYNEIMELYGADEFKDIIKKWDILSENVNVVTGRPRIILPDLLWIMNSGVGRTNLLNHLSEYLYSKGNLMDFSGNVKFFEFLLNYHNDNVVVNEIQRFMDSVSHAAGFRNNFRGVVCVDVSEWVNHYEEKLFTSFLELLSFHSDEWLIVLVIGESKGNNYEKFISFVSAYLRIETLKIETPNADDLFSYLKNKLSVHGLSINCEDCETIKNSIKKLKSSEGFDGFKTIDMLVQDIAYEHFCIPTSQKGEIPRSVIDKFNVDSEYVNRIVCKQKPSIGF